MRQSPATPKVQRLQTLTHLTVWASSRSLAATEEITSFSVPEGTEMFHFPSSRFHGPMYSAQRFPDITQEGLPHSEISGSKLICNSPELIAACHVFRRLLVPRHPPYALSSLIKRSKVY